MRDLATSLKSPQIGTWTQNDLQLALKNSKFLKISRDTLNICFLYWFKILALFMMITKSFKKKIKLTWNLRLKLLIFGSLSIHIQITWNLSHIYVLLWFRRFQTRRCKFFKNIYMTKKPELTQSFQKLIALTKHFLFFLELKKSNHLIIFYNPSNIFS
jgi:hypothetical protein